MAQQTTNQIFQMEPWMRILIAGMVRIESIENLKRIGKERDEAVGEALDLLRECQQLKLDHKRRLGDSRKMRNKHLAAAKKLEEEAAALPRTRNIGKALLELEGKIQGRRKMAAAWEKEVEDLEAKVKKLEDRLGIVEKRLETSQRTAERAETFKEQFYDEYHVAFAGAWS